MNSNNHIQRVNVPDFWDALALKILHLLGGRILFVLIVIQQHLRCLVLILILEQITDHFQYDMALQEQPKIIRQEHCVERTQ